MGQVFKVRHTEFDTQLAVKTLFPQFAKNEDLAASFKEGSSPNRVGKKVKLMARKAALDEQ